MTIGGEGVEEEPAAAAASKEVSCFARSFQLEEFCMEVEVEERFLDGFSLVIGVESSEGVKRDRTEEAYEEVVG